MNFVNINDVPEKEILAGYKAKFIHTSNMTFVYWDIEAQQKLPKHSHPHEQVAHLIHGEFELTIGTETKIMKAGDLAIIPANIKHSGYSITDCKIIDAFYPIREDYIFD
jgi:quercetin dioxygenase-like cupin family protein